MNALRRHIGRKTSSKVKSTSVSVHVPDCSDIMSSPCYSGFSVETSRLARTLFHTFKAIQLQHGRWSSPSRRTMTCFCRLAERFQSAMEVGWYVDPAQYIHAHVAMLGPQLLPYHLISRHSWSWYRQYRDAPPHQWQPPSETSTRHGPPAPRLRRTACPRRSR